MGRLLQIELENFKSYGGHQVVGPFSDFTSIIGPNGSGMCAYTTCNIPLTPLTSIFTGKSNLMDAISFVLGVKSAQLRSANIKDVIHRRSKESDRQGSENSDDDDDDDDEESRPTRACVTAKYKTSLGEIIEFKRTVNSTGTSEYTINGKTVPFAKYNSVLEKENVLVKARNFLVFQVHD